MDGLILVDKPAGVTSHDVVARVRREVVGRERSRKGVGKVRVGHSGTLDPFATGLLVVLLGRATRVQAHVMALPKRYEATARLGFISTTGDPEGEISRGRIPPEPLVLPTGTVHQRPPAYSAVKVGGEALYKKARRGEGVEGEARPVTVHRAARLWLEGERAAFEIECSSGTYVRTLLADLGDAYCTALRRTAVGPFDVADATSDPTAEDVIALGDALERFVPVVALTGELADRAAHGLAVAAPRDADERSAATVLLRDARGPIALAVPRPDGTLKPVVGFRA